MSNGRQALVNPLFWGGDEVFIVTFQLFMKFQTMVAVLSDSHIPETSWDSRVSSERDFLMKRQEGLLFVSAPAPGSAAASAESQTAPKETLGWIPSWEVQIDAPFTASGLTQLICSNYFQWNNNMAFQSSWYL